LAFSPDGTLLAAGSVDTKVRVWDVRSGALKHTLEGHTNWVASNTLAFAPDGKTLASGGLDGLVILWDPATGAERAKLDNHSLQLLALAFAPDGKILATSSDTGGSVTLWEVPAGRVAQNIYIDQGLISSLAYSG